MRTRLTLFILSGLVLSLLAITSLSSAGTCSTLQVTAFYPSGQGFVQGDVIPFVAHVQDNCGNDISGATVTFTLTPETNPSLFFVCTSGTNNGFQAEGGWYRCDRSSANRPKDNYTMDINASASGFSPGFVSKKDAFDLGNRPSLTLNVSDTFSPRTQNVIISSVFTDADFEMNSIKLQISKDQETWTTVNETKASGIVVPITFVQNFTKQDKGRWFVRLRALDEARRMGISPVLDIIIF